MVDVAVNKAHLAVALEGAPVWTAIKESRCNFTLLWARPCLTFNRKWGLSQWGMTIIGVRGGVQHSHQYKSVMDTLAEEEGLPCTAVFTLFDADTDLWHAGSREPLSQRGPGNQGHFVGFRRSKEPHIYKCAWSQPPSSPRRQDHLVEIKLRTFPNSWPALVLSFNNRMNGMRTAEGIKKSYMPEF